MRLIDADAFKKENERLLHCDFPYLSETTLEELIKRQPTVEAIPIEWIMCYAFDGERKRPISITKMIADWRKEHAETD